MAFFWSMAASLKLISEQTIFERYQVSTDSEENRRAEKQQHFRNDKQFSAALLRLSLACLVLLPASALDNSS